jgi:phosphatidate cytidylyltransferase
VPAADPATPNKRSNLALRVLSSLVIAPIAILVAWTGGWLFVLFWSAAALIVFYEWTKVVAGARQRVMWVAVGAGYAAAMLAATLLIRADAAFGFAAMVFVFAVVWFTDIAAYFVGRRVGGPKLMPRVSPNKTWSGAVGGTLAAIVAGALIAMAFGLGSMAVLCAVAAVLAVVSQAGDLLESALKRHFNVKDASQLLPGHGGLMDRLDGYATAVVAAALVGLARGGFEIPARGLLVW